MLFSFILCLCSFSMQLLVQWQESREVMELEEHETRVDDKLRKRIGEALKIPLVNQAIMLQKWDDSWNTYINIREGDLLVDRMLLKCVPSPVLKSHSNQDASDLPDAATAGPADSSCEIVRMSWSSVNISDQLLQEVGNKMSLRLKKALEGDEKLEWAPKHELIQLLCDVLYKYDTHPSREARAGLAKALISKYQKLKNRLGEPHAAWMEKINNGLKSLRAKDPEVVVHTRKRKAAAKSNDEPPAKRGEVSWQPALPHSDDILLFQQKELMKRDSSRANKDIDKIKELMMQTYAHRRHFINDGPKITDIMDEYPALFSIQEVSHEFHRLMHIDLDHAFFTTYPSIAAKLVLHAGNMRKKSTEVQSILTEHSK